MKLAALLLALTATAYADDPAELDRDMIATTMKVVTPDVKACGKKFEKVHGTVKVSVVVAPSGALTKVEIKATPDDALGGCVADAVQKAKFPATKSGGSFSYPYVF